MDVDRRDVDAYVTRPEAVYYDLNILHIFFHR